MTIWSLSLFGLVGQHVFYAFQNESHGLTCCESKGSLNYSERIV